MSVLLLNSALAQLKERTEWGTLSFLGVHETIDVKDVKDNIGTYIGRFKDLCISWGPKICHKLFVGDLFRQSMYYSSMTRHPMINEFSLWQMARFIRLHITLPLVVEWVLSIASSAEKTEMQQLIGILDLFNRYYGLAKERHMPVASVFLMKDDEEKKELQFFKDALNVKPSQWIELSTNVPTSKGGSVLHDFSSFVSSHHSTELSEEILEKWLSHHRSL
jgi:hypothetical protein